MGPPQVLGNVYGWVEDSWHESYQGAPVDGSAWITGYAEGRRVLRGELMSALLRRNILKGDMRW